MGQAGEQRASVWYRVALWAYPSAFRQRFGVEMEATFAAALGHARRGGRGAVLRLWTKTLAETLVLGALERIAPSRRRRGGRRRGPRLAEGGGYRRPMIGSVAHDMRIGARSLARRPSFAVAAVLTLGLGIGANTAVFSAVYGVLLRPLDYRNADELVVLWPNRAFSTQEVLFLREHTRTLSDVATVAGWFVALTGVDEPTQLQAARTSANVFRLLGVQPALGRTFVDEDVTVGAPPVVMLSHRLWATRFGSDSSLVGTSLTIDGESHEVVGVMPRSFEILDPTTALWIPLPEDPNRWEYRANVSQAFGRLAPGVTAAAARAGFPQLLEDMKAALGFPDDFGRGASLVGLKERLVGGYRTMFMVLLGAVGFILLIAGSNLSNLLLAKAVDRRREMAVRAALGATRRRLIQVVLVESSLLSVAGGIVGLVLALGCVALLKTIMPAGIPRGTEIAVNTPVLVACFGFAVATGLLFSVAPAAAMTRLHLHSDMGGVRTDGQWGASSHRLRQGFVVVQIALAVMLVVGAGLMIRSLRELAAARPGFEYHGVLTLRLFPVGSRYDTAPEYRQFYLDVFQRLEALPGVVSVGAVQHLPLSGMEWGTPVEAEGQPVPAGQTPPSSGWRIVAGRYFETLGIRVLAGRAFAATDIATSTAVALVNQTFAQRFWPGESPIGKRFKHGRGSDVWVTVVGLVENVSHSGLGQTAGLEIYRPHLQSTMPALMVAVRTTGDPERLAGAVQREIWNLDPDVPIADVMPMADLVAASYGDSRLVTTLLTVFAAVALSLGAVGVYGVTAFAVSRRVHEIGLRIALGASAGQVRREVLRVGLANAVVGTGIGLAGAVALARVMERFMFGVSVTDPATLVGVAAAIVAVALAASYLPARRATKIDPAAALRVG